jgi:hypothetical protein
MDIMVYNRFEYNNYKYILTCIDVYSRYAQAIPLKTKHLNVDQELWNTRALQQYYKDNDIKVYPSERGEINKNAVIERFHRTLAKYLMEYRLEHNDENWPNYLDKVINYYNNRVNRGVGYPPAKLTIYQIRKIDGLKIYLDEIQLCVCILIISVKTIIFFIIIIVIY